MKNIKLMISLFLLFIMSSCTNFDGDCECDPISPKISQYGDTELVEYCMPKTAGLVDLPQYTDWDTILFGYGADYSWDISNLDSIKLLKLDTNYVITPNYFCLKKNGKEILFDDGNFYIDSLGVWDDESRQIFKELTRQIVLKITPRMLNRIYYIEDDDKPSQSNPFLKQNHGYVLVVVRLVPPKK